MNLGPLQWHSPQGGLGLALDDVLLLAAEMGFVSLEAGAEGYSILELTGYRC